MRRGYRKGEVLVVDDRTGFVHRSSEMHREWNGLVVHRRQWEARHPQDFIRTRREDIAVKDARPRPIDAYVGPLRTEVTASSSAGSQTIVVLHTDRFVPGDHIGVLLNSGDLYQSIVQEVTDATHLLLTTALPGSTLVGGSVINFTAVSP